MVGQGTRGRCPGNTGEICAPRKGMQQGTGFVQDSGWGLVLEQEERAPKPVGRPERPTTLVSSWVMMMMGHVLVPWRKGCVLRNAWLGRGLRGVLRGGIAWGEQVGGTPASQSQMHRPGPSSPGRGSPRGNAAPCVSVGSGFHCLFPS